MMHNQLISAGIRGSTTKKKHHRFFMRSLIARAANLLRSSSGIPALVSEPLLAHVLEREHGYDYL